MTTLLEAAVTARTLALLRGARELSVLAGQALDRGHVTRALELLGDARELAAEGRRRQLEAAEAEQDRAASAVQSAPPSPPALTPIDGGRHA